VCTRRLVTIKTTGFKEKIKSVFISCGSPERPEGVMANQKALNQIGIRNVAYVSPNTGHEFLTWRRSLYQMAQHLFQ